MVPAILATWVGITNLPQFSIDYRAQFIYPFILVYTLMMIPTIEKNSETVVQALRPVTQLNDGDFKAVVNLAFAVSPARELLAIGAGMAVGLAINVLFEPLADNPSLLDLYAYLSRIGIFGVIGWIFYTLSLSIRVTNEVLSQPIDVDPFDLKPFEPIGRQSLLLSLTVLGGAILSLLSASIQQRSLWIEYVIVYGVGVVVIFFLFFWSMRSVHHLLAETKRRNLDAVEHNIAQAYYDLQSRIADNRDTLEVATKLNALVAAQRLLRKTRTWPFNTEMLSTLSVAVLAPLFVGLARILAVLLGN